ncbi:MAG: acyl-CoA dehydrogenase [Pseudomonadota bacterium]
MNFDLTEERQMLQDSLRRFLRDRYDTATRNRILDSDTGFDAQIWSDLAELGILGALFPEDRGGFGGAGFDIVTVFEELGRAGVVEPVMEVLLAGQFVPDDLLDAVIAGDTHFAFAHAEPDSRYDLDRIQTRAEPDADGYRLTGRKSVVQNAEAAEIIVTSARDGDTISLFSVRPEDTDLQAYPLTGGGRAAEMILDGTPAMRLTENALPQIEAGTARAATAQCAETLGAMETAMALTREYLMTRTQFGKPIGSFQALQHRFADMAIEMEQARSAVILAAHHLDGDRQDRDRHVSMAKQLIGRVGRLVAEESIQMHGGIAMTQEYELAHIAKRIVLADHRFGDTDHHLERFIALG